MKTKLLNNIELKILSLVIALVLWIIVRGEQRTDIYLSVKVETKNLASNLLITSQSSDRINIKLKGPKTLLSKINQKYFRPYVCNLAGAREGRAECKVIPSNLNIESGIRILEVTPKVIFFELDKLTEKEVGINPDFMGKLDTGYEIEEYKVYPERISVRGPRSYLKGLEKIKTAPIDLKGRRRSFVVKLPVAVSHPTLKIEGNIDEVLVNVRIRERQITRIIKNVPVQLEMSGGNWRLSKGSIDVKISGPAGKTNDIKKEEIFVVASKKSDALKNIRRGFKVEADISIREIPGLSLTGEEKIYIIKR